jgi:hypothetical protein
LRIFKTRAFQRFARRERISQTSLCEAVARAERGLIDADLGGGVIKQRIARPGQGRSGGYRTILAYRVGARSFFLYGFAKNELDNVSPSDLSDLQNAGQIYMALSDKELDLAVTESRLIEVTCDD